MGRFQEDQLNFQQYFLQVFLANEFQTGTLPDKLELNGTLDALSMEDPVIPPEEPPSYTSPEERAELMDLTWAEQSALNNTDLLEEYVLKSFAAPSGIFMSKDIEDEPREMEVISPPLSIYAKDTNGSIITQLGDSSDPWKVTVSAQGPGEVMGTTTVDFVNGLATFDDIYLSLAGSGYKLVFTITYPFPNTVGNCSSITFNVGARPLDVKITDEPLIVAQSEPFTIQVDLWDLALDNKAATSVVSNVSMDCSLVLNKGDLNGTTSISVPVGEGGAVFDDLMIETPDLFYNITATCQSPETQEIWVQTTGMFHIHDFPETGLLARSVTTFGYKGSWANVRDVVANTRPGDIKVCKGCPRKRSLREVRTFMPHEGSLEECSSPIQWDDIKCNDN